MKKDTKIYLILTVIIILIILGIYFTKENKIINEKTAKCISENSFLYTKLGCPACEAQEKMFEGNYQYLNKTDCYSEIQKCIDAQITGTPTWIINGEKYPGVQSIEKLKELTGC